MKADLWTRMDLVAQGLTPFATTFLVILASFVPLRVPAFAQIVPLLALVAVYYWSVYRPEGLPIWLVFLLGLLHDILSGGPLGVTAAALILVQALVSRQRRHFAGGSFAMIWVIFLPVAILAFLVIWLCNSALAGTLLPGRSAAFQCLTTLAVYPCCAWIFTKAQGQAGR